MTPQALQAFQSRQQQPAPPAEPITVAVLVGAAAAEKVFKAVDGWNIDPETGRLVIVKDGEALFFFPRGGWCGVGRKP